MFISLKKNNLSLFLSLSYFSCIEKEKVSKKRLTKRNRMESYSAHVSIARNLEGDKEHASIEEKHVALPFARIVVGLEIDGLGDW
jgi:hypothetical protein